MASGDTLNIFFPQSAFFDASGNYPAILKRNTVPTLSFDDTTSETAWFTGFLPRHYAGTTGVTITIGWMFVSSGTPGTDTCKWDVGFYRVNDDAVDLDSAISTTDNTVTDTSATADGELSYATITFTDGADMDSVTAGELFLLSVKRDAAGGTASPGDAQIVFVEIQET